MSAINTKHPLYLKNIEQWTKNRDFASGEQTVKAKQTKYLPYIGDPRNTRVYTGYLHRAIFFGAVSKTISALCGLMFRKAPTFTDFPTSHHYDEFVGNSSLSVFLQNVVSELFLVGRHGVLVDMDSSADSQNVPYFVGFDAEQIINWYEVGGQLQYVILKTQTLRPHDNPYDLRPLYQILELRMEDGVYKQFHYESLDDVEYHLVQEVVPTSRGQALGFIPFLFVNPYDVENTCPKAPLTDLVDLNNHHYIKSADYANGLHYVGLPTPYATGVSNDPDKTWMLGSENIITLSEPSATFGYAEVTGAGFSSLDTCIKNIEANMAQVGGKLIGPRDQVIAAETTRLLAAAENASLVVVANTVESLVYRLYSIAFMWMGTELPDTFDFTMSKDFTDIRLSAGDIQALIQAYQNRTISLDTFLHNLKVGEVLPDNRTVEEEKDLLNGDNSSAV